MIDKRLMYAQGQRVAKTMDGSRPGYGGPQDRGDEAKGTGAYGGGNNNEGASSDDYGFGVTGEAPPGPTTDNDSDFDPFGHSRFNVGSGYYGEPVTSGSSNLGDGTTTFAPIEQPTLIERIIDGIQTIGKTAIKGAAYSTGLGALGLSPKAVAIANTALGFTNDIGLTKSGSIGELGLNTLDSLGNVFSGNTNKGNTGMNTNSFSGNTNNSLSDNNQNNGGEGGNNDVLSSEYILLLQKMQLGNFTQEDQTRFNLLKTMLGK